MISTPRASSLGFEDKLSQMLPRVGTTVRVTIKQKEARFIGGRAPRGLYLDCGPGERRARAS
jgi:hypothetical protein